MHCLLLSPFLALTSFSGHSIALFVLLRSGLNTCIPKECYIQVYKIQKKFIITNNTIYRTTKKIRRDRKKTRKLSMYVCTNECKQCIIISEGSQDIVCASGEEKREEKREGRSAKKD